ncbi:MAG: ABC transporter permease [Microbacterium sp.]
MQHAAGPSGWRRVVALLWFPCLFAAGFATLGLFAFAHPTPHHIQVGLIAPATASDFAGLPQGIDMVDVPDSEQARDLVASGELAAATDGGDLYLASAASSTRFGYLEDTFAQHAPHRLASIDVNPLSRGDASGVGLFFYALPNLLVGLVTSIALLQAGAWPIGKKALTILGTGLFSAIFTFVLAVAMHVIPADPRLIGYALLLTQAIGWLTTAAAVYAKRYFMPLAMTFVLIIGIPSSGGTVNADMLPYWVRWLGEWHPFAQFIELARAQAYLGSGIARPLAVVLGWAALGGALLLIRSRLDRREAAPAVPTSRTETRMPTTVPTTEGEHHVRA